MNAEMTFSISDEKFDGVNAPYEVKMNVLKSARFVCRQKGLEMTGYTESFIPHETDRDLVRYNVDIITVKSC